MHKIAYQIQPQSTLELGYLVLNLCEIDPNGSLQLTTAPKQSISHWKSLNKTSFDKELFNLILKEELLYQEKRIGKTPHIDSLLIQQMHVSPSQVEEVFKLFSITQNLYCEKKQLIIDVHEQVKFFYEGTILKNGQLEVMGKLRLRNGDILLTECQCVGQGKFHHWFVRNITLKLIYTSVQWKKLKSLLQSPLLLEGGIKQTFLDELEPDDLDSPQLIVIGGDLTEFSKQTTPYPVLVLKDRWGASADLWMRYGEEQLVLMHDHRSQIKDKNGQLLFQRDSRAELNWEKDLLETDFVKKLVNTSHYYCPLDRVAKSLTFLLEIGWEIQDYQSRRVIKQGELNLQFEEDKQAVVIKGNLQYDTFQTDIQNVIGAFNRRENFVQLSSNAVGLLPTNELHESLKELAEESEWTGKDIRLKKIQFGTLSSLWPYSKSSETIADLKSKWTHFEGIIETPPSSLFHGKLRPYQQEGVNWLSFLREYGFHGILADEMGLGKTVQVLSFLSLFPREKPHLIVMPTSLLFNWSNERKQFLPSWSSLIHQGVDRAKKAEELLKFDVIFVSYATLRLDIDLFRSISFATLILDEAQVIKNASTQTSQALCSLKADLRLSLTGTPVENHIHEIWAHFHFLIPELLGPIEDFEAEVQAGQADRRFIERIKRKINPFILRRRKQEVATDLPARIDQTIWVEMSEKQRNFYEKFLAGYRTGLLKKVNEEGVARHRMDIFEALLRLRQICCHPLLVTASEEDSCLESAKFDALLEDLETIVEEKHKVLVYSQFTSMLKLMKRMADQKSWSYGYLDGSTKNREEVVNRFQNDFSQHLFFISLKAGGVGLNLTSADYVYLYDPWWNEAVEEQAINRAHRIGRGGTVIAKRFVMKESIEEKMMSLKHSKSLLIDDILDTELDSKHITIEDLHYLLS